MKKLFIIPPFTETVVDEEANDSITKCEKLCSDFKSYIREYVFDKWINACSKRHDNKLHEIKPNICKPLHNLHNYIKHQFVISRCHIGHAQITRVYFAKCNSIRMLTCNIF